MDKRKCAVLTIVKNEKYFLPVWLKHYKKYFLNEDIYVLDHETTDGSTDDLDVHVTMVNNELSFDHQWLLDTVKHHFTKLLETYEAVLFSEADELVYSVEKPLSQTIEEFLKSDNEYVTCRSHEVYHDFTKEIPITGDDKIFPNRKWWFYHDGYDKTLLSKIHLPWHHGFHRTSLNVTPEYKPYESSYMNDLYLIHLQRCDHSQFLIRHLERVNWEMAPLDGKGDYNKQTDLRKILDLYSDVPDTISEIEESHKKALHDI